MKDVLTIWQLADGKPGHENQSLGLIEAIGRMRSCEHHRIDLSDEGYFWSRWMSARKQAAALPPADLILGAGHALHFPIWLLRRASRAKALILMKPSLPMGFFDLCIAPRHDFPTGLVDGERLILTDGAINRVIAGDGDREGKLILLGGPSKNHGWDAEEMIRSLAQLTREDGWQLTDSRRTPKGFVNRIRNELPQIQVHSHAETSTDWLPQILQKVEQVWVSEDSVSMTYEALSSGAKVGLLPVPRAREHARVLRGLDHLIQHKRLTPLADWLKSGCQLDQARPLREADRCAQILLKCLSL